MKVVLYTRVSTDEQTVEPQLLDLRAHCQRSKWEVVHEFTDIISGAKAARPGLDELVRRCEAGGIEAVVCVKLDRLGRSVLNVVTLVQKLKAMGTSVICTSQGIDNRDENPCGKMVMGIMAAFAEFERDIIRDRTKAGLRNARAKGKVLGKVSVKLVDRAQVPVIIGDWRNAGKPGGFRGLATRLGGCSPTTARRLVSELTSAPEEASVEV